MNECAAAIWEALLNFWAAIYTGLPNCIFFDQWSKFGRSNAFISLDRRSNVTPETSGTDVHGSLDFGERYHAPPKPASCKMRIEFPYAERSTFSSTR